MKQHIAFFIFIIAMAGVHGTVNKDFEKQAEQCAFSMRQEWIKFDSSRPNNSGITNFKPIFYRLVKIYFDWEHEHCTKLLSEKNIDALSVKELIEPQYTVKIIELVYKKKSLSDEEFEKLKNFLKPISSMVKETCQKLEAVAESKGKNPATQIKLYLALLNEYSAFAFEKTKHKDTVVVGDPEERALRIEKTPSIIDSVIE